ncbi:MAG: hypothetical protein GY814_13455 [Gammaproteobacteria bacterium]|nr:hypothetical protein [Gammaproteobacteria bacterium]
MLKNALLLVVTLTITTLISEVIIRQIFHPVDYLLPVIQPDQFLGHRVASGSGGHDAWGFRNYLVPDKATIVAIGDSQTYGVSATYRESWPAHLSKLRSTEVYNLALGGYGPLQYLHLLKSKALNLNPETVIVGLYFGNDLLDADRLAYTNPKWESYKNTGLPGRNVDETEVIANQDKGQFLGEFRRWLAQHSVLYRLGSQSILGDYVREAEYKKSNPDVIDVRLANIRQFFPVNYRHSALNPALEGVSEGMRISKLALTEIKKICAINDIELLVALIPTKELVFSDLLAKTLKGGLPPPLAAQIEGEMEIRSDFFNYLSAQGVNYVDVLPALRNAASEGESIYPINDGHTNGNGYSVIAREINSFLP